MKQFLKLVSADYLQRCRSYAFLITLAVTLYATWLFVPAADASYTTLRIGQFLGRNNAAWSGYVSAMMSSVFLSMIGFYLINSNIKKDINSGVGMIIAATAVSNFKYLLSKVCSNFLVLLSIMGTVAVMSITVFLFRAGGYPFHLVSFVLPFILITLPALFFISCLAVTGEVLLYRYHLLMNIGFWVFFMFLLVPQPSIEPVFDVLGIKVVTKTMQEMVTAQFHVPDPSVGMGFHIGHKDHLHLFIFEGISWPAPFIVSRIAWMGVALSVVYLSSLFFHRFNISPSVRKQKKMKLKDLPLEAQLSSGSSSIGFNSGNEIKLSALPKVKISYQIIPFIKTELLMLFRKGPRYLWLLNLGGMLALVLAPVAIAHQLILPGLWFLQVARLSDLSTKERTSRIYYFTNAAYRPLSRLFTAQILSGVLLFVALAMPLMIRYLVSLQFQQVLMILLGAMFIVLSGILTGLVSGGKKLFEILFFALTYANINKAPFIDYFGAFPHGSFYLAGLFILIICLTGLSYLWKRTAINNL